jgi:hypothetical protein
MRCAGQRLGALCDGVELCANDGAGVSHGTAMHAFQTSFACMRITGIARVQPGTMECVTVSPCTPLRPLSQEHAQLLEGDSSPGMVSEAQAAGLDTVRSILHKLPPLDWVSSQVGWQLYRLTAHATGDPQL